MRKGFHNRPTRKESILDKPKATTEGLAKTGQVSKLGTVTHYEHRDGRVDATVRPGTVSMVSAIQEVSE
jgi:hypothetical protein